MNREETLRWMAQWREAAPALEGVRVRELASADEAGNAIIASRLVPMKPFVRSGPVSGLVQQQAYFLKFLRR